MKELSIEEKAKVYDEAIKKVNDHYEGKTKLYSDVDKTLDYLFSALKESEDEKIRKDIIWCLKHSGLKESNPINPHVTTTTKDAIAWLEKQGKRKPAFEMKAPEESLGIDSETYNKIVDECIYGEQNPKWTPMDEQRVENLLAIIEEHGYPGEVAWLNSLKDRVQPNPAWSEEDEITKNNISHIIRQYDKISKRENKPCWYIGDYLLWMQNIKDRVIPQPQKEWREEDEKMLRYAVDFVSTSPYPYAGDTLRGEKGKDEVIDWLKSLKDRVQPKQ